MIQQDNVMFFQKLLRDTYKLGTDIVPPDGQKFSEPVSDFSSAISWLMQSELGVLATQHFCTRSSERHATNKTSYI